jgi:hypothetical protein
MERMGCWQVLVEGARGQAAGAGRQGQVAGAGGTRKRKVESWRRKAEGGRRKAGNEGQRNLVSLPRMFFNYRSRVAFIYRLLLPIFLVRPAPAVCSCSCRLLLLLPSAPAPAVCSCSCRLLLLLPSAPAPGSLRCFTQRTIFMAGRYLLFAN